MNYTVPPNCSTCPLQGKRLVLGTGPMQPKLMIIGEAPGAMESSSGTPFVGKSGQLLRGILRDSGFDVENEVYFTNVVMCRPPSNRDPSKVEIKQCADRLRSEIATVQPEKILLCGTVANNALGKHPYGIWSELAGVPLLATVHPAFCLRQPDSVNDLALHINKCKEGKQKFTTPQWQVLDKLPTFTNVRKLTLDIETTGLSPRVHSILWIGLMVNDIETVFIIPPEGVDAQLLGWLADPECEVVMHNADFDAGWMMEKYGATVNNIVDTMLLHYCADGRTGEEGALRNLKKLAREYLDAPQWEGNIDRRKMAEVPLGKLHEYLAYDVWATYLLEQKLRSECVENDVLDAYFTVISPSIPTLAKMSARGVRVDVDALYTLKSKYEQEVMKHGVALQMITHNQNFNPNAPAQVASHMFDKLGLPQLKARSTDKLVLAALREKYPDEKFLTLLGDYRFYTKFLSTYVNGMLDQIERDGRIHTHFLIPGTVTGRLSSRNPNLQNVPVRVGPDIRNVFVADEGHMLFDCDFSQLEVRVAAHVSGDPYLTQVFVNDEDVHTVVAQVLYDSQEVTRAQRSNAKNVGVFGVIYGVSLSGFMDKLGLVDHEHAARVYAFAKEKFSGLLDWVTVQHELALNQGYVQSMFGRRRWFPIIDRWNVEEIKRQAANMPIQSAASDICLLAANKIENRGREGGKLFILGHDSIVGVCEDVEYAKWVADEMRDVPFDSPVPFKASVKVGQRWGEVEEIS